MSIFRVKDINWEEVRNNKYSLGIFASGYEERCTHVPKHLKNNNVEHVIVLGFTEKIHDNQREENDKYFEASWEHEKVLMSGNDETPIYNTLREYMPKRTDPLRILVDYSSMTRIWYAAVLNWAKFRIDTTPVIIDFVYSVGRHQDNVAPFVIENITAVPGCEGIPMPSGRSVSIFGLGFDGMATLCVLDRLEPDCVHVYFADPGAHPDYADRTRHLNKDLIETLSELCVPISLFSVEKSYTALNDITIPQRQSDSISVIPMGPKPHVLAAILMAIRFSEITCLRVSGTRIHTERVGTSGDVVATRVMFKENVFYKH